MINHTQASPATQAAAQLFPPVSSEPAPSPTELAQLDHQKILHATLATITHFFGSLPDLFRGPDHLSFASLVLDRRLDVSLSARRAPPDRP